MGRYKKKFDLFRMDEYHDDRREPMGESLDDEGWLTEDDEINWENPMEDVVSELSDELSRLYFTHQLNEMQGKSTVQKPTLIVRSVSEIPTQLYEAMPHKDIEECRRVIDKYGAAELILSDDQQNKEVEYRQGRQTQPHHHSFLETTAHMVSGFLVAMLVVFFMFPEVHIMTNLTCVSVITGIKFVVNYLIRRHFAAKTRQ